MNVSGNNSVDRNSATLDTYLLRLRKNKHVFSQLPPTYTTINVTQIRRFWNAPLISVLKKSCMFYILWKAYTYLISKVNHKSYVLDFLWIAWTFFYRFSQIVFLGVTKSCLVNSIFGFDYSKALKIISEGAQCFW